MSTIINNDRRVWLPLALGLTLLLAGIWGVIALQERTTVTNPGGTDVDTGPDAIPGDATLPQARWKTKVYPAGGGKPSKATRKTLETQGVKLAALADDLYDRFFIDRRVKAMSGNILTVPAARALASSKLRPDEALDEIQAVRRSARIGIDAASGRRASVELNLRIEATVEARKVRFQQRWLLWLTRSNGWHVVAFEGDQEPLQ